MAFDLARRLCKGRCRHDCNLYSGRDSNVVLLLYVGESEGGQLICLQSILTFISIPAKPQFVSLFLTFIMLHFSFSALDGSAARGQEMLTLLPFLLTTTLWCIFLDFFFNSSNIKYKP